MDFALRCNNLKCRAQLTAQAVVTTCSHIFCGTCSHNLGLDAAPTAHRTCPACETSLPNPDDAVSTQLNPTEDYKTSVLSGLSPSTIVECAGRGLAFWSYQSTQEIVYQEYLAKSLTDKYNKLGTQVDKIIHDANTEITALNQKLSSLQIDQEKLQAENTNLVQAFREKSRKHQQTQELYDRLKRKEMTAATQSAAFESVDDVLGNVGGRTSNGRGPQQSLLSRQQGNPDTSQYPYEPNQGFGHQRDGSNGSGASGGGMPPPSLRRPGAFGNHLFGNSNLTPSQHRTQLGSKVQSHLQQNAGHHVPNAASGPSFAASSSQRPPFGGAGSVNRPSFGGYGMSAGLKVGRQHGTRPV
ncbi:MAG: hypothetical protein Q9169_001199 [Polycauliona sp. 2 TL-2023]